MNDLWGESFSLRINYFLENYLSHFLTLRSSLTHFSVNLFPTLRRNSKKKKIVSNTSLYSSQPFIDLTIRSKLPRSKEKSVSTIVLVTNPLWSTDNYTDTRARNDLINSNAAASAICNSRAQGKREFRGEVFATRIVSRFVNRIMQKLSLFLTTDTA